MNGINRRGQKVVCVIGCEYESSTGKLYAGPEPEVDQVYTVKDFPARRGFVVSVDPAVDTAQGFIELFEIPSPMVKATGECIGWPIVCFRPVDERKTDISEIRKAGQVSRRRELIPTHVSLDPDGGYSIGGFIHESEDVQ